MIAVLEHATLAARKASLASLPVAASLGAVLVSLMGAVREVLRPSLIAALVLAVRPGSVSSVLVALPPGAVLLPIVERTRVAPRSGLIAALLMNSSLVGPTALSPCMFGDRLGR